MPLEADAREKLTEDICVRFSLEKQLIDKAMQKAYHFDYELEELLPYITPEFVSLIQAYIVDPFSAPVWKEIESSCSRLRAGRDVADKRHLQGG